MNNNKKFYKVYEVLDNVSDELEVYPTYFVGAFLQEADAVELCGVIDVADCNSTKIVHDEITYADIEDLKVFGLQAADETALAQIATMLENQPKANENNELNQHQPE